MRDVFSRRVRKCALLVAEICALYFTVYNGLIFYDYNKKSLVETTQVNCFFRRICEKAGVTYYGQHALHHTFATRCIESGIQPVVLKTWMGHTNIHITLDVYAYVFDKMNDKSVAQFDRYLDSI